MKQLFFVLGLGVTTLLPLTANAASYVIDTKGAHAAINFKVSHLGYSFVTGRFNDFGGSFEWDPANPESASVEVTIKTASVDSNHAERDKHLRGKDFLAVDKYPSATFKSTGYKSTGKSSGELSGLFTLHGKSKTLTFPVTKVGEGKDPWGGYRAGFTGTTTIMLGDFGMDGYLGNQPVDLELIVEGVRQ